MQTQTSNTLHNAIMEASSKDRPPMLAPGNYVQWKSRIKRYIDTKPNHELIHYCLENPPYDLGWKTKPILDSEGNPTTSTERVFEKYKNVTQEIRDQPNAEAEAIERLKQGESINVQDLETNLFWEFGKFTSQDGESLESYYSRSGNVAGARETVGSSMDEAGIQLNAKQADWKDDTDDESDDQELEAHYMYMAKVQEVSPDAVDFGPIFDTKLEQKIKLYKTREDKEIEKVIKLENKVNVLDNIVYKTGQSVQTINMLNNKCRTSFVKPVYLKKAKPTNPRLYDIGCFNDNIALMLTPESDEVIRLEKESQSKILPANKKFILKNTNVLNPGMYKIHTDHTQTRTSKLPSDSRKTNKCVTFSIGVIPSTSVSRPQLKSNPIEDRVLRNNSHGKKQELEDHRRNVKLPKNKTSITACNDSLNTKTLNVKSVSMCDKCVLHDKHDICVLKSVAKPIKRKVASKPNKKPKNFTRKIYEHISKTCSWWYPKSTPSGYIWKPKSRTENVNPNLVEIVLFIVDSGCSKHMTGNLKLLINFMEKFLGTVKFGNDQITPILGYGDLGNDPLSGSHGTDLYSIILQDTNSPNPICLVAKATSSQAWLWHRSQVGVVRTDKGTEFLNQTLHAYFAAEGIQHQTSVARTPEQNGVVERRNRTLVEAARSMLTAAKLPLFFWAEAIATACFTQNHSLVIPRHEKTPYHIINDRSVKFFHIFGSVCYIVRDRENLDKIKEKGDECIFVRYSTQSKAYRVFNKRKRVILESIHVNFDELPLMASDQNISDPALECQTMASDQNSSNPAPECQTMALNHDSLSPAIQRQGKVVSKSSAVSAVDALNQHQQLTTPLNNHTTPVPTYQIPTLAPTVISSENINQVETYAKNDQVADDEFINIFSNPVQDQGEMSIRHVNSLNMQTFYQRCPLSLHQREVERFQYLVRRLGMRCLTPAELETLTNEPA
nr:hypothetical protein [Tanacetum cinerariifolium]